MKSNILLDIIEIEHYIIKHTDRMVCARWLMNQKEKSEETSAISHAVNWLEEALNDCPIASKDIHKMAKDNDISSSTLRRAQVKLGIKPYKEGLAQEGQWFWKLPNE